MSFFTKPGSEIYVSGADSRFFGLADASNPLGLNITDTSWIMGVKAAWCNACEGALVDLSNDSSGLEISLDLHAIEHKWFESYPPISKNGVIQTRNSFHESLTPGMQEHEKERLIRMEQDCSTISDIYASVEF